MRDLSCCRRRLWVLAAAAGWLVLGARFLVAEGVDAWRQPDRIVADMGLKPGDTVADVGCGKGYYTFRVAAAVGEKGMVFAVDINPSVLKTVRQRAEREHVTHVEIVLSEPTDTKLKGESVGSVLLCNVIHEVPASQRAGLLKSIVAALKPGGFLFLVDWRKARDVPFELYADLIPRDDLVKLGTDAGLTLDAEFHYLKYQVYFRFRKPDARPAEGAAGAPAPSTLLRAGKANG